MYDVKSPTVMLPSQTSTCAVNGCRGERRNWSHYCTLHARRVHMTRDPNGRAFHKNELKPYREMALQHLARNLDHVAVVAAIRYMEACLTSPSLPPAVQKEMRRLYRAGAEPMEMLVRALSVFGLIHFNSQAVGPDVVATFNLGRAVLLSAPMEQRVSAAGKVYNQNLNGRVCVAYGQTLRDNLGRFQAQFWSGVEKTWHGAALASQALRTALDTAPLSEDMH
ncbi:hypothetical protein J2X02_003473 [Pseudoxanthomonas japonensis]|uniref:hypothetical protein n=1 Tax=Pseudoxanthomonas japonensis TaxID=69284 RepID=UPI00285D8CAD|nr:hypothetical protein [Pseudoxanthomonas japonensis]MDR7070608.1 hypothetical protein [Pseudoxanthomonas japonensis]